MCLYTYSCKKAGLIALVLFLSTIYIFAEGTQFMWGGSWSADGHFYYMRGTTTIEEDDEGTDTALTTYTTASVDADPAINYSLATSCNTSCGGIFDDSNASPVLLNMSAGATWSHTNTTNNPAVTGSSLPPSSNFYFAVLATGRATSTASVEGAGLMLTAVQGPTGSSTTGFYTLYDSTVVPVSSGAVGMDGISYGGGGEITAISAATKTPHKTSNPPFSISSSSSVSLTYN